MGKGDFELCPLVGTQGILSGTLDQTGIYTTWLWGQQYKTIIGSLCYLVTEEMR